MKRIHGQVWIDRDLFGAVTEHHALLIEDENGILLAAIQPVLPLPPTKDELELAYSIQAYRNQETHE